VPGAQEEVRRNSVETETNEDKSSSCDVAVTRDYVMFSTNSVVVITEFFNSNHFQY